MNAIDSCQVRSLTTHDLKKRSLIMSWRLATILANTIRRSPESSSSQHLNMRASHVMVTSLVLSLLAYAFDAKGQSLNDPWLEGESRGYLMALCRMEEAGLITPQQSTAFLMEYRESSIDFKPKYLEAVLRNYIGLKTCSFSKRVVIENKQLLQPATSIR